jgi:hypothetical protein
MLYAFAILFPLVAASVVGSDGHTFADNPLDVDGARAAARANQSSVPHRASELSAWAALGAAHSAAPLLTFLTVLCYFGMNEVAREVARTATTDAPWRSLLLTRHRPARCS